MSCNAQRNKGLCCGHKPDSAAIVLNNQAVNVYTHWSNSPDSVKKAITLLDSAIEKDPDYQLAYANKAEYLKNTFRKKPSEMEIFEAIQKVTKELAQHGTFNFILSNGEWMIAHCSTNLHYVMRQAPFGKAHRIDDDGVIDFSDYAKEGDKVNIITTFPLTKDENWTKMENGGFVFFKNGNKIAEVIGTPKEAIDDGTLGNRAA